ncbi:MAG: coenzyme F420-0:L-glutamate ligase [Oscillospiraceae bacterium]|nr:coenzyme F420-0:L-glutamate ligase [Oscillospiraceae bacterium]
MRTVGAVARGIRTPIIREGDDLVSIVRDSILAASEAEGFAFHEKDVIGVTESVVARAAGNYANVADIAADVKNKFGCDHLGVIFPITSRNRFAIVLRGIAMGVKKITLMLSYPSDEVGNHLFDEDKLEGSGINPYSDVLTEEQYRAAFGFELHPFTGVDYVDYYKTLIQDCGCEAEILFANQAEAILEKTKNVLCCDIHTRFRTKRRLLAAGAEKALGLDDLLTASVNGSGYNEKYGLLGSNKSTEEKIKLFPRNGQEFVDALADAMEKATGKKIECMIYGDGAFKDPVGKIWELADPVVSPACTKGLLGTPNELKIKYLADNDYAALNGEELTAAVQESIRHKESDLKGCMASQGTTPRQLTDLIGSLCDLTSGSGDKGTPVVFIQGYFDNYSQDA